MYFPNINYVGIALGIESESPIIYNVDFSFVTCPDESFDLVFSGIV